MAIYKQLIMTSSVPRQSCQQDCLCLCMVLLQNIMA